MFRDANPVDGQLQPFRNAEVEDGEPHAVTDPGV